MYRSLRLFLVVVWIVIAAACVGILGFFLHGHGGFLGFPLHISVGEGNLTESVNQSFQIKDVQKINIQTGTADVTVKPSETNQVHVSIKTPGNDSTKASANLENGTLNVTLKDSNGLYLFSNRSGKVEVELPESYVGALFCHSSVGDVNLSGNYQFSDAEITCSTGDITAEIIEAESVKLSSSVGDIKASEVDSDTCTVSASTGDVKVDVFAGSGSISSSVGDIHIGFKGLTGDLNCSTSTGDVHLTAASGLNAKLDLHTSMGEIHSDFPITYPDNGKKNSSSGEIGSGARYTIKVSTSIGDIHLVK